MKTFLISRCAVISAALAASMSAGNAANTPALGLLRLKSVSRPTDAAPLVADKFSIDDLSATGVPGAARAKKNNVDYLALDAGKEWSRPLEDFNWRLSTRRRVS